MDPGQVLRRSTKDAATNAAAQAEFNEKRRVWIPDVSEGFLPGWIKTAPASETDPTATAEVVVTTTNETRTVPFFHLSPMNPPQFDGVDDIADLTHLNEASVINNLRLRYGAGSIYTYSGLFLISLNPYRNLPIYTARIIAQYRTKRREENPPHIFAVAERAWQQIGEERESQSILITQLTARGESGAGKTENTKKVIQYLAAIATHTVSPVSPIAASGSSSSLSTAPSTGLPRSSSFKGKDAEEIDLFSLSTPPASSSLGLLERQILQANPILEAFGNAQTMRNNNSSRFGKFIRIYFNSSGAIAGANIDWYLLEKSRVTKRAAGERTFHVFYQLLKGAKEAGLADKLLLQGTPDSYEFLKMSRKEVDGVEDLQEWRSLKDALSVVGFTAAEQFELFRIPAVILHIGNLLLSGSSSDQALITPASQPVAEKICHLLGIPVKDFTRTVLTPKTRAGREWVTQARTKKQAEDELAALCKFMYEKSFGCMVDRINLALDRPSAKALSIGVLDIAGFEIFEENSYEQLLINFTNEKLQQFFNFHMFTLEQEEYTREGIEWNYVNFGLDLQPTIELIESTQPVGILSCLDEECIMPKATDLTFTEKVQQIWDPPRGSKAVHAGSAKIKHTRFGAGFVVKHYAGDVEYRTEGWLEKNKDPINEAVAKLLSGSDVPAIASLFGEYAEDKEAAVGVVKRVKRGAFRTVGQRHKEQLGQLMGQLGSTQPHFVRCIVPNSEKKPGRVHANLVLDQLRCNGVLEGIRIARLGYPNRHSFAEFRSRYEVLTPGVIPKGYMDGRKAAERIAEALEIEKDFYKIGATKIFFKAGVLADLEERRDNLLTDVFKRFQSAARMYIARRRILKLINRAQAVRTIQRNARVYIQLRDWPWWSLYVKVRPLLAATRTDEVLVKKQAELAMAKERAERDAAEKIRLEEVRAALVQEKEKVEVQLSSERQLGLDKDRMLERSKAREAELQETISALESDLDVLDKDREAAILQAAKAKEQLAAVQHDFDQLLKQAELLEKESAAYRIREAELLRETKDRSAGYARLETERKGLDAVVEGLKREVAMKEEAVKRAKERADQGMLEAEKRLQLEKGKADSSSSQVNALNQEIRRAKSQIEELEQQIKRQESSTATKQREIAELEKQVKAAQQAQQASEQAQVALTTKLESLRAELFARDKEKKADMVSRQKLEKEIDDLRQIMAAKSSEDIKRQEADKSRDLEMARLREQVVAGQKAVEEQREQSQKLADKLRGDFEGVANSWKNADRELKAVKVALEGKERELEGVKGRLGRMEAEGKEVEEELRSVGERLSEIESAKKAAEVGREQLSKQLGQRQTEYEALEDAVLEIEAEKANWAKRMESTSRQLIDESAKRQHFEQSLHQSQLELAEYRASVSQVERDLLAAQGGIKERDKEIALLRSRENKTIVEHVHVLESAKKYAEKQLHEQVNENRRLNGVLKNLEAQRNRLQNDLEDGQRQMDVLRQSKSKEARKARVSMTAEEKEATAAYEDERRGRLAAEAKLASMEIDMAGMKRQLASRSLSSSAAGQSSSAEAKLARRDEELSRMKASHEATLAHNQRLQHELGDLQRSIRQPPTNENKQHHQHAPGTPSRADLLRGLEKSHDALGRDMSEQLRKLDAQPLTPSRRHNATLSNGHIGYPPSPSAGLGDGKRVRQLETEINGLRQQLEDEREEKEWMAQRLTELEGGGKGGKPPFPYEQAMYSHFRLKAKSLRSQLDHWLAMEDLQNQQAKLQPNHSGMPRTEDVQQLRELLNQLDAETSPIKHVGHGR